MIDIILFDYLGFKLDVTGSVDELTHKYIVPFVLPGSAQVLDEQSIQDLGTIHYREFIRTGEIFHQKAVFREKFPPTISNF